MHKVLKLAVVVFVGGVTGAGAAYQPVTSPEQTDPISYASARPHSGMLSIAPRATAAPSNSGLRMAQGGCSACNMLYQQGASQCQAYGGGDQYRYCMAVVQQNVGQCMQMCASGGGGGGYGPNPGYPPRGQTLCETYPNNPACR